MPDRRLCALALALALLAGCATIPREQQAFVLTSQGEAVARSLPCTGSEPRDAKAQPLPGPLLRVVSWNLHKNEDAGWDADLARFVRDADLVLIQEAALDVRLREVLEGAGFDWILGSSFEMYDRRVTGVLSAARVQPMAACTQRFFEPLLRLPKAAVITRYALRGGEDTLAVANLHAINFSLSLGEYRRQLEAIADELAGHRGPIVLAGDFNSWNSLRLDAVGDLARRLQLDAVVFDADRRTRFFGQQVDYLFVRGLQVVDAATPTVASSDHNPVLATLRLPGARANRAQ